MFTKIQRLLVLVSLVAFSHPAGAAEIAITLDDLPYVMPSKTTPQQGLAQVQAVNAALAKHSINATGFVIGDKVNHKTRQAIDTFANAGHEIGNHSWSHPDYGTLTTRQFQREVRRTDRVIRPWARDPKFYRFPYLREGETETAKGAADRVLAKYDYTNAPVTIDNDEWKFNADYVKALTAKDHKKADAIAANYIAHMKKRTAYFQTLSRKALGRDPAHILLLHMNQINADHLGTLLDWYAAKGWTFITLERAMADPLYSMPDLYVGQRGLSQIERIMGKKSD